MIGHVGDLFILPLSHRSSLISTMFGIINRAPTPEEIEKIKRAKRIIYNGFKKSLVSGMPKESAAILVDEEFGDELLKDAQQNTIATILTTEKTGQNEFNFEYDGNFAEHIKKYNPTFVKALIHYNPEADHELNIRQADKLKILTDFAHSNNFKLIIEPFIPATPQQLESVGGDPADYDRQVRPALTVKMMKELQDAGADPDVWKLEGMEKAGDYQMTVEQARSGGRNKVGVVVLGRAAETPIVENWLRVGAKVQGVIGFAVGRTIFWEDLTNFEHGKLTEEEASTGISQRFMHFYKVFIESRSGI